MTADPKIDRAIWLGSFERRKAELIKSGMSESEADDIAANEIRRDIRRKTASPT